MGRSRSEVKEEPSAKLAWCSAGDMSGGDRPVPEANRPKNQRSRNARYDGSSTIGVFACAARLVVTTIATPMQATAMPSHMVAVGGTP